MLLMPEIIDNVHRYFATTVGLITTKGSRGRNVMAAEWTMHVSYDPMLIAVFVHDSPTYWNIQETHVFGVNIASEDQAELVNISGGYSGSEIDKLGIPGIFETYSAKHIDVPMIRGCALSAECRATTIEKIGDHIMVVGEAVSARVDENKFPLIYTRGNYRRLSRSKIPSGRKIVRVTKKQISRFKAMSGGQFVLKGAAAIIRNNRKVLLQKSGTSWMLPIVVVTKGADYKKALQDHLASIGIDSDVGRIQGIARMTLKSGKLELRTNFVIFECAAKSNGKDARWFARMPRNLSLRILLEKA